MKSISLVYIRVLFVKVCLIISAATYFNLQLITPAMAQIAQRLSSVKLNDELSATGRVVSYKVSPDGGTVVFVARFQTGAPAILYSIPIEGGTPIALTPAIGGRDVSDFEITPDGSRVVFRGDINARDLNELFSVPIDGGTVEKLSGTLVSGGDVENFQISLDSNWVVYLADQETDNSPEIFSVPVTGGVSTKLNAEPTRMGVQAFEFQISPSSDQVVFINDPDVRQTLELFSVPIEGGDLTQLDLPLFTPQGEDISQVLDFTIAPDGQRVIYRALQRMLGLNRNELYSVPTVGGVSTAISADLFAQSAYLISEDSTRVVFAANEPPTGAGQFGPFLFSVPINGGLVSEVATFNPSDFLSVRRFNLDNNSERVIYQLNNQLMPVFSVPLIGGSSVQLNDPPDQRVIATKTSQENSLLAYTTGVDLNVLAVEGGPSTKVNLEPNVLPLSFQFDPAGQQIAYIASSQVYISRLENGRLFIANGALVSGGSVFNFEFNQTGQYMVYRADQEVDGKIELFATPIPQPEPEPEQTDEFCFPIATANNSVAVVCL